MPYRRKVNSKTKKIEMATYFRRIQGWLLLPAIWPRSLALAILCLLPISGLQAQSASWYNTGWGYRKAITISHTKVSGSSSLSNFPVLISLSGDANLEASAKSDGSDLLFTASDGVTKLNHEIEQFTSSTGQLVAWVQVPTLSTSADTVIYLYYGNPSAASQQNAAGVWSAAGYQGVWHFGNGAPLADSTSNGNTLTNSGTTATSGGAIGAAMSGPGNQLDGLGIGTVTGLYNLSSFTYSGWVNLQRFADSHGGSTGLITIGYTKLFGINPDGTLYGEMSGGRYALSNSTNVLSLGSWAYVVATFSPTDNFMHLYLNGQEVGYSSASQPGNTIDSDSGPIGIADLAINPYDANLEGIVDEVRIANTNLSAGWIATEYSNQSSPGAFFSLGPAQGQGSTAPPSALTVSSFHTSSFVQGQAGTYTVTVSNAPGVGAATGTVAVTESLPSGLALVSVSGSGWSCTLNACSRSDSLAAGASFPPLTAVVNVAANASSPQLNSVTVSGGGSASNTGTDPTTIIPPTQIITTTPAGLSLSVDGTACTTPCSFAWTPAQSHTVAAPLQPGVTGVQYLFASWSDGGAAVHTVTSSANPAT